MSSVVISGNTSGSITLSAPDVSGSNTLSLPAVTDTLAGIAATQTLTNKTLTSPVLTTPALGTPASGVLTNCTGVSVASVSGTLAVANGGTGVTTSSGTGAGVHVDTPTFTGVPAAPTAASATNTTQIATTAFAYGTLSNAANGYTKLANGVIIQWGLMASSGDTSITTVTFPITFPTAFRAITGQQNGNNGSDLYGNGWKLTATSTSSVNIKNSTGGTNGWYWIAIGI